MFRFAPALLVCLLACTGPACADDAYPPLDQRLGKTITVVEKNHPTEKAVITQVWRMEDGTPVMQARTVDSKTQLTLMENLAAKSVTERIKVIRWVNGVRPEGCPLPPATKGTSVVQAQNSKPAQEVPQTVVNKTVPVKTQPVAQTQYSKPVQEAPQAVVAKSDPVVTTEGGLLPVLPKKEEARTAPPVLSQPAVLPSAPVASTPVKTEVAMSAKAEVKVVPPVTPAPATIVTKTPAPMLPAKTISTTVVDQSASATVAKPELVGGCEVLTVTENGVARKYMILGTARDKHGVMTHRCQALDTKEIITLNCDNCQACAPAACKPECPPVAVKCTPAPVKCEPVPVKCEPAKVVCAPAPVKVECKPCEPAKVACEPAKPAKACEPCAPAKACDPCNNKCADGHCDKGNCGAICKRESLYERSCRRAHGSRYGEINVPVPGVYLSSVNGAPGGPPPQPVVPAFCTMNSSSVQSYMCARQLMPMGCLYRPFGNCLNSQITAGIYQANGENGEAVASTLYLINVLNQSTAWENRQWAAQRLEQATLPTMRPYVEDSLLTAAQNDRAPLVKVAAIRTLASMKSTRQELLTMLAYAAGDEDPRIREAANDAMSVMQKSNSVNQAAYTK